jgi:betaine-aldehyde dehydrogenase
MGAEAASRRVRVEARVPDHQQMLLGGELRSASDGVTVDVIDPSTERLLTTVPRATAEDVGIAVKRGTEAQAGWARLPWQERAATLQALADRVEVERETLAELDAVDGGLAYSSMGRDIDNAVAYLRYYASLASELKGETVQVPGVAFNLTVREPYGVVGRIVPFNHPLQFAAQAIAAPLAAGNSVVLKPADQTPLSALKLGELARGILPDGVLSVITGDGATTGHALVSHPAIRRIGFTGSVETARIVMRDAAQEVKALSFELGGKNPMIVFPDADPDAAAAACVQAMNFARCQGQSCGSPSRVFVHESIRDEFSERLVAHAEAVRLGDALDEASVMGPLAFRAHYERVKKYVEVGKVEGAQLLSGGERPSHLAEGYFLAPTVFAGVTPQMTIAREEIFGPVVALLEWNDLDDVVKRIHELPFGLTANIWTNDLRPALRLAHEIQAGYVQVNGRGQRPFGAPFGGYGISGLGKENDLSELLSYTQVKNILIDAPPLGAQ